MRAASSGGAGTRGGPVAQAGTRTSRLSAAKMRRPVRRAFGRPAKPEDDRCHADDGEERLDTPVVLQKEGLAASRWAT